MSYKKQLCRNFQRGSCQYGERCKFLHPSSSSSSSQQHQSNNVFGFGTQNLHQQNQKPNNPFGFGTQSSSFHQQNQQNQKPNPFGFGVQNRNTSHSNAEATQNQSKPFQNKWSRNTSSTTDNQSQPATHTCTDPESCKREIAQDFQNEKPLWNLTCYGHRKNGPCDIIGDISFEELRAAAYDDVKRGLSLQSIVEKERSLLNTKLIEFENLLRNPYNNSLNSSVPSGTVLTPPVVSSTPQNSSSFSALGSNQLAPSNNMGFGPSSSIPLVNAFPQSNAFSKFGTSSAPLNNAFQQPSAFQNFNQSTTGFGNNKITFGRPDSSGNQLPVQSFERSSPAILRQNPIAANNQSPILPNAFAQAQSSNLVQVNTSEKENVDRSGSIWLKEKWGIGEIPEEEPPEWAIS